MKPGYCSKREIKTPVSPTQALITQTNDQRSPLVRRKAKFSTLQSPLLKLMF